MFLEPAHRPTRTLHLAPPSRSGAGDARRTTTIFVTTALLVGAIVTFWPFAAALVLALWAAHLSRPLFRRFRHLLGGRGRSAAVVTAILVIAAIAPIALAVLTLVPAARTLLDQLRGATGGKGILEALVSNEGGGAVPNGIGGVLSLARDYGAGASKALALFASASLEALVGAFVFFAVYHSLLVEGEKWWEWTRDHAPVEGRVLDRLALAFYEAGRGLIVGSGLTALVQGGIATALYAVFGVPRALLLGMLSVFAALVPMAGPMIVWVPVCLGLAFTGQPGKALGLAVLCTGVVGTVDNVIRPWLSRRFEVGMPATVVLVSMLGGVIVLGGWGLFLGPLVVRLAAEMLRVCRERGVFFGRQAKTP